VPPGRREDRRTKQPPVSPETDLWPIAWRGGRQDQGSRPGGRGLNDCAMAPLLAPGWESRPRPGLRKAAPPPRPPSSVGRSGKPELALPASWKARGTGQSTGRRFLNPAAAWGCRGFGGKFSTAARQNEKGPGLSCRQDEPGPFFVAAVRGALSGRLGARGQRRLGLGEALGLGQQLGLDHSHLTPPVLEESGEVDQRQRQPEDLTAPAGTCPWPACATNRPSRCDVGEREREKAAAKGGRAGTAVTQDRLPSSAVCAYSSSPW